MRPVVFLDCGDTLVDEATEIKDETGASLRAEFIPGADALVRELKSSGYRMGLVADGPHRTFVNNLGSLFDLFDVHAISGQLGFEKPSPEIFMHALTALRVAPEQYRHVVMVGNNLERDIRGANLLGLTSVWIDWAPRRSKVPKDASEIPDHTIRMPLDLLEILRRIGEGTA